jgi:invasion protein IalB
VSHTPRQKLYILLSLAALAVLCLPDARAQAPGRASPLWPTWTYTPWTKTCNRISDDAKLACSTAMLANDDRGLIAFSAEFIEVEGTQAKTLRVMVPPTLNLLRDTGLQVSVDYQGSLRTSAPSCLASPEADCVALVEVTADLIGKLKQGQTLIILATSQQGTSVTSTSYPLPLAGFVEAIERPATSGLPTAPARR